ncbi:MAG TPA: sulfatase, partial [Terriglobales bacterium]|nr:sulfatase [Terriglobales bacterium]
RPTSPNLAQIARQGVVFDNAISPAPWTLPAHASFLTGLLPHEHGADEESPLDTRHRTLGEALQARGYRTAAFSANSLYFSRRAGLSRGFIEFDDYFYSSADMFSRTAWGRVLGPHFPRWLGRAQWPTIQRASEINRRALRWIDSGPARPFLVFLNYFDLHTPRMPPEPYRSRFARVDVKGWALPDDGYPKLTREQKLADTDAYDAAIAYDDAQVQKLFTALQARGLDKNTLVVITADHGESLDDHGILRHRNDLYRELLHVPLIFWWPGKLPAGKRIETPISTARLASTLLDLMGQPDPAEFPGNSLAMLWRNPEAAKQWPYPVSEVTRNIYAPANYPTHYGDVQSIVAPQWQLIVAGTRPPELYRWVEDPAETRNLADSPAVHDVLLQLNSLLRDRLSSSASAQMANEHTVPSRLGEP